MSQGRGALLGWGWGDTDVEFGGPFFGQGVCVQGGSGRGGTTAGVKGGGGDGGRGSLAASEHEEEACLGGAEEDRETCPAV